MTWTEQVAALVPEDEPVDLVISADVDGLLSAGAIAARAEARIIGVYSTKHVVLFDGATLSDARDALWLDHDISRPDMRCIGQHLTLYSPNDTLPLRCPDSFNPNIYVGQAYRASFKGFNAPGRDKYPFGTVHLLRHAFGIDPPSIESAAFHALAHADGSWASPCDYAPNCKWWNENFFDNDGIVSVLCDGFTSMRGAADRHARLVEALAEAGVNTKKARGKMSPQIREEWQSLEGHQSITFAVYSASTRSKITARLEGSARKLSSIVDVLNRCVDTEIPRIGRVTDWKSGHYEKIYPNQVGRAGFDAFMLEHNIFSHAFTLQSELKYTIGLFDDEEATGNAAVPSGQASA